MERAGMRSESWRPQRRERGLDPQIMRMAAIAAGAVVVLGFGYGGYSLLARGPRAVPVIEADSRPLRVRPDNPGGMQVAGAEEQIMGGSGTGKADGMAPAPEVPQPQALRAQIQAARQPAPPPQPVSLTVPPAPPLPVISALPEQRTAVPLSTPARAPAPRAAPAPAPAPTQAGGTEVQLAALESEAAAMAEWQRLAKRMPDLLATRHPAVQRAERDGKPIFRLRTGGFTDIAQATSFCTQIRAKGAGCSIASF